MLISPTARTKGRKWDSSMQDPVPLPWLSVLGVRLLEPSETVNEVA